MFLLHVRSSGHPSTFSVNRLAFGDLPGGPVGKNLPYKAGDSGSLSGRGAKTPHAVGHLSLPAATTETGELWSLCPQLERVHAQHRRPTIQSPCPQLARVCTAQKMHNTEPVPTARERVCTAQKIYPRNADPACCNQVPMQPSK